VRFGILHLIFGRQGELRSQHRHVSENRPVFEHQADVAIIFDNLRNDRVHRFAVMASVVEVLDDRDVAFCIAQRGGVRVVQN